LALRVFYLLLRCDVAYTHLSVIGILPAHLHRR
jgi:hypothetical protein